VVYVRTGGLLVEDEVNARKGTYTTYSIGVGIVWAVILVIVSLASSADKRHTFFLVFGGFVIGWVSATIARYVYPPPKKYRPDNDEAS
jgi:membrane-associated phospholipid phosphatase